MSTVGKIRDRLKNYKTYITIAIGILSAFSAWLSDAIPLSGLIAAIVAGLALGFDRAGTAKVQKAVDNLSAQETK